MCVPPASHKPLRGVRPLPDLARWLMDPRGHYGTRRIETGRIGTHRIGTRRIGTPSIGTDRIETHRIETHRLVFLWGPIGSGVEHWFTPAPRPSPEGLRGAPLPLSDSVSDTPCMPL